METLPTPPPRPAAIPLQSHRQITTGCLALVIPREAPIICAKRIKKPGASHNIAARAQASPREREHHRASANITARARTSPRSSPGVKVIGAENLAKKSPRFGKEFFSQRNAPAAAFFFPIPNPADRNRDKIRGVLAATRPRRSMASSRFPSASLSPHPGRRFAPDAQLKCDRPSVGAMQTNHDEAT